MAFMEMASLPWAAEFVNSNPWEKTILPSMPGIDDEFLGSFSTYPAMASFDNFSCSSADTSGADVSSPGIISFCNSPTALGLKRESETIPTRSEKKVKAGARPPALAQDHIIAERKRRENLSRRFIALSALLPGLKKMDKASVLGDAVKYVKELQERVTALEEKSAERRVESAALDEESTDGSPLPEIEVKLTDKNILVRIHCEKRKGLLSKLLTEIENFHLSIINTSSMTFADTTLDITVTAQIEDGFSFPARDLVKHLSAAYRQHI